MATINSTISSIHVREHDMARGNAVYLCRERFALLVLLYKKGNETTLETINYILEFWLLFHNFNFVYGLCYGLL